MKYVVLTALVGSLCGCAAAAPSSTDAGDSQTTPEASDALSNVTYDVSPNGVIPACDSAKLCRFAWGAYVFAVDASGGARIVQFSLSGHNILVTQAVVPSAFGATFWPSPQSVWNWPPNATIDTVAYSMSIQATFLF